MLNLEDKIGLKVLLKDDNSLEFDDGIEVEKVSARKFIDLAPVVADENVALSDDPAYMMYRNVRLPKDDDVIQSNNLRFDLTVIPAAMIGDEFVKTSGHYHPTKPGTEIAYPELYYVVAGQATYLMQKKDADGTISDVLICRVNAGEAIIMPSGYGHVTINETSETLVMANWVSNGFKSIYDDFEVLRGGSYYILKQGRGGLVQKNQRYDAPNYKEVTANPVIINELNGKPIYSYITNAKALSFLDSPEDSGNELEKDDLFKLM